MAGTGFSTFPLAVELPEWVENQKLTASDGLVGAAYGVAIAVKSDRLAVGAPNASSPQGDYAGAVYVYARDPTTLVWESEMTLTPSDGVAHGFFGQSLVMTDSHLAVGTNSSGPVYVFAATAEGWGGEQKVSSPGSAGDGFGTSVALDGTTLLVGALADADGIGAAHVFTLAGDTWVEQATLHASDGDLGDYFGISVALSGDTAVIGAFGDDTSEVLEAGAAYVFVRSGSIWTQQQKLVANAPAVGANAGLSVSIEGDTVVVGAPNDNFSIGAAYVWTRDEATWSERIKLVGAVDGEQFGYSTVLLGGTLALAATNYDGVRGRVHVLQGQAATWTERSELRAKDATEDAEFGRSVSLDGATLVIGAPQANAFKGAAYVASLSDGSACEASADCDSGLCRDGACSPESGSGSAGAPSTSGGAESPPGGAPGAGNMAAVPSGGAPAAGSTAAMPSANDPREDSEGSAAGDGSSSASRAVEAERRASEGGCRAGGHGVAGAAWPPFVLAYLGAWHLRSRRRFVSQAARPKHSISST